MFVMEKKNIKIPNTYYFLYCLFLSIRDRGENVNKDITTFNSGVRELLILNNTLCARSCIRKKCR